MSPQFPSAPHLPKFAKRQLLSLISLLLLGTVQAQPVGQPMELSGRHSTGDRFMDIRLLGALALRGNKRLAELSGLAWDEDEQVLYGVTDRGYLLHLQPEFRDGELVQVQLLADYPLKDTQGKRLSKGWRDAEGLAITKSHNGHRGDSRLLISFEGRNRIARYTPEGRLETTLALPGILRKKSFYRHSNNGLEALAIHPELGLLTGPERAKTENKISIVTQQGDRWFYTPFEVDGALVALEADRQYGGILILERAYRFPLAPWVITLSRAYPEQSPVGSVLEAKLIAKFDSTQGWWVQNFEGLTHHRGNRYFMVSDDGGHGYLQTQLLYFEIH